MDSDTNDMMRNYAFLEAFKADALDVCMQLTEERGLTLSEEAREYVLTNVDELATKFEIIKNYDLDAHQFQVDDDSPPETYLKVEDVEKVFYNFRERLTTLILQIVLYDLEMYLARKGKK